MSGREIFVIIYHERSQEPDTPIPYKPPYCITPPVSIAHNDITLQIPPGWRLDIHNRTKYTALPLHKPETLTILIKTLPGNPLPYFPLGSQNVWLCGWTDNPGDADALMRDEARRGPKGNATAMLYDNWEWTTGTHDCPLSGLYVEERVGRVYQYDVHRVAVRG